MLVSTIVVAGIVVVILANSTDSQDEGKWYKYGRDHGVSVHGSINSGVDVDTSCQMWTNSWIGYEDDEQIAQEMAAHMRDIERGCRDHLREYYGDMLP